MGQGSGSTTFSDSMQKGHTQTSENSNTAYDKNATFNPAGAGALSSLSGTYNNAGANSQAATDYYKQQMNGAQVNPYYSELAKAQGAQADQAYAQGLKQTRSAGYGGGVGADSINQNKLAANYANQKASNQANLLAQAFQQQQQQKNTGAQGLAGQNSDVLNFLSLLRGESGTGDTTSTSRTDSNKRSLGSSNTISGGGGFGGS